VERKHFDSQHHHHGPLCSHPHDKLGASHRIGSAFLLNFTFTIIELIGGYFTNSLAILSDAIHDLGDSLSLGLAWYLERYSQKKANESSTYGYRRWSVLSALLSALTIMLGSIVIIFHAVERFFNSEKISSVGVVGLAMLGVIFNFLGYWKLKGGSSLSEKVLKYHLLEDLLGWLLVLVGGIVIYFTNWFWLDPILALGIAAWIFFHVLKHFISSLKVFMQMWPDGLSLNLVQSTVTELPEVQSVHHVHGWSIDGERHIVTMHVVLAPNFDKKDWPSLKRRIKSTLKEKWNIIEVTLEPETVNEECADPAHEGEQH
jgi:cobalt-zinc-cadmium efflux system protein